MCHMPWPTPSICGMSYALLKYHVAWPSICAMWLVISQAMCHMAWPKPKLDAMWHGLGVT
jgi:hypothetical protein